MPSYKSINEDSSRASSLDITKVANLSICLYLGLQRGWGLDLILKERIQIKNL